MKKLLYVSAIALVMALPAAPVLAAQSQSSGGTSMQGGSQGSSSLGSSGGSSMTGSMNGGSAGGAGANAGTSSNTASRLDPSTIRSIQQALNSQGFNDVTVDGQWGSSTQTALLSFQREQGLTQTGQPDTQTLQALGVDASGVQGSGQSSTGTGSTGMSNDSGMTNDNMPSDTMDDTGGSM